MGKLRKLAGPAWLAAGLVVGILAAGLLPRTPLRAVATDRLENCAIATGFVDESVEAVYFLDVLTGTLKAAVVSNMTPRFQTRAEVNLNADLMKAVQFVNGQNATGRTQLQVPSAPNYVLVSGIADLRRTGPARTRPSRSLVYVAETTTGVVLAYILNWDQNAHSANKPTTAQLSLWAFDQFSSAVIRTQ